MRRLTRDEELPRDAKIVKSSPSSSLAPITAPEASPAHDMAEELPRDAKMVKSVLKSMGVENYEPRVVHQFLELWYRYVFDVLCDAQVYSEHAGKAAIDCDDVKLAIQSKVDCSFSQPPPREVLWIKSLACNAINKARRQRRRTNDGDREEGQITETGQEGFSKG